MASAITIMYTEINNFDKVGVLNDEHGNRQVTIEILESIARNGQVFTLEHLHRQTQISKNQLLRVRRDRRGGARRSEGGYRPLARDCSARGTGDWVSRPWIGMVRCRSSAATAQAQHSFGCRWLFLLQVVLFLWVKGMRWRLQPI
ncbi:protein of unknown function [Methanoculleus bourgensis]|mgnify:FL=1|jgi:hypothetical protein|uniref:Uncharacterized protein n=1 Tax=Methanoculleus bourgensis TaxID=83986 RepID=A0A0X3BQC8_9EURY|nr:protein of unknown function [Methanoculleus bourgensis]